MASLHSRWEAKIVIPAGDWTMTLTEDPVGAGAQAITLTAANTYYWNSVGNDTFDLETKLKNALENASDTIAGGSGNTYTVTVGDGELGTGLLTISVDSGTFTLTSINNDLQALMGFTPELTPTAASFAGDKHVEAMWLPNCPVETPYGLASSGLVRSAAVTTFSSDGSYNAFHGAKHTSNEYTYQAVSLAKTVAASEGTTSESYETFWLGAIRGEEPWAVAGRELRYHADTTAAARITYNVHNVQSPNIQRTDAAYDGFWQVHLDVVEN